MIAAEQRIRSGNAGSSAF